MEIRDANLEDLPGIVGIYNSTVPSRMVTADPEPILSRAAAGGLTTTVPTDAPSGSRR